MKKVYGNVKNANIIDVMIALVKTQINKDETEDKRIEIKDCLTQRIER